jgi:hypothetical protein
MVMVEVPNLVKFDSLAFLPDGGDITILTNSNILPERIQTEWTPTISETRHLQYRQGEQTIDVALTPGEITSPYDKLSVVRVFGKQNFAAIVSDARTGEPAELEAQIQSTRIHVNLREKDPKIEIATLYGKDTLIYRVEPKKAQLYLLKRGYDDAELIMRYKMKENFAHDLNYPTYPETGFEAMVMKLKEFMGGDSSRPRYSAARMEAMINQQVGFILGKQTNVFQPTVALTGILFDGMRRLIRH